MHFLLDCISFELCLPFVVLHQYERIRASAPPFSFVRRHGKFHPLAPPSLHLFGGSINSIHPLRYLFIRSGETSIVATPFLHFGSVTAPPSLHLFGRRIDCCATIFSAGQRISSLCRNHFSRPANPIAVLQSFQHFSGPANLIAVPQSFQRAGKSHSLAAIFSAGRRITSPCRNHFSRPANPIAALNSFQRSGEFHRHANNNNNNNSNNIHLCAVLPNFSFSVLSHVFFAPSQSSFSSRHHDHLIFIAPPRSSSSSFRRCAHLYCCVVCSSHHCAIERSIRCAFGCFASQFIVAPLMSRALFIVAPLWSRAQVHCCAVEVASSSSLSRRQGRKLIFKSRR